MGCSLHIKRCNADSSVMNNSPIPIPILSPLLILLSLPPSAPLLCSWDYDDMMRNTSTYSLYRYVIYEHLK